MDLRRRWWWYDGAGAPLGKGLFEAGHEMELAVNFSLRDGEVWASRHDSRATMMLGQNDEVLEAMRDFIRQAEFAQRLLDKAAEARAARA
jgi:hypothetical protein